MKKLFALLLVIAQTALICACGSGTQTVTTPSDVTLATSATSSSTTSGVQAQKPQVQKMSDFAKLDNVKKIRMGSFPYPGISLFKMDFVSEGLSIRADIILPDGYENGGMPLVMSNLTFDTQLILLS